MAVIKGVSVVLPEHSYSRSDIISVGSKWLKDSAHQRELFERFVSNSQISRRHFAIPLEQILSLRGAKQRADIFQSVGSSLLSDVTEDLMEKQAIKGADIDYVLCTSCSVPTIPALDVYMIDALGLRKDVHRVPVYQYGCAGGIIGLALAHRLLKKNEIALMASVEICSLVYQSDDLSGGNLVGSALFGDGAAAALLGSDGSGMRIIDARSHLIPASAHLMGYSIEDDGTHLRLDRGLPQVLAHEAPLFLKSFLADNKMLPEDVKWWLFHPGGVKVLQALESAFGISPECSRWAWDILDSYGNMSSASVLFVIEAFFRSNVARKGDTICILGVGPGLTVEAIVCTYQ